MTNMVSEHDAYRTSELALAAVLALACPLEAIDCTPHAQPQFVFRRDQYFDELMAQYWRGELRVEPQAYAEQLRRLGDCLRNNPSNPSSQSCPAEDGRR